MKIGIFKSKIFYDPYYQLLRVNHWFKNVFLLFGVIAGFWFIQLATFSFEILVKIVLAFLVASFISSVNYIINQIADVKFDLLHEEKKKRPVPSGSVNLNIAVLMILGLLLASILISFRFFSFEFINILVAFIVAGIVYNIPPLRLKDVPYLDVLSESINNPIRFLLGWYCVVSTGFPPITILLITWSAGAILMTAKRYDELRHFKERLVPYRATFKHYSLTSLRFMLYLYSLITLVMLGLLFWRYKPTLLITLPLVLVFFSWLLNKITSGQAQARSIEAFVLTKGFLVMSFITLLGIIILAFY